MVYLSRVTLSRYTDIKEVLVFAKAINGFFPVLKAANEPTSYTTRILRLKLEDDLGCSLKTLNIPLSHASSLEQVGTGLLVYGIGLSSKFTRFFDLSNQTYEVTAEFGVATDTYCCLGKVIERKAYDHVKKDSLQSCFKQFIGNYKQLGSPYYYLPSHQCQSQEHSQPVLGGPTEPRDVVCFSIECTDFRPPTFSLVVHCGGFFSACSLVDQIGKSLGCAAHVSSLKRSKLGPLSVADALPSYFLSWQSVKRAIDKHKEIIAPHLTLLKKRHRKHHHHLNQEKRIMEAD